MNLPLGTWIKSSKDFVVKDKYLIAKCRNIHGKYILNKVKVNNENETFTNINGKLVNDNIINLDKIPKLVVKQKLGVCVVSYGGSGSNLLADKLSKNGYISRTNIWRNILCHCPEPVKLGIPIIYIYRNPIHAFFSMKRRGLGIYNINQKKLANNKNIKLSDENLIKLMIKQFYTWTNSGLDNLLIIKYDELFKDHIKNKLQNFLNKNNLKHFPIKYRNNKRKYDINTKLQGLFNKYKKDIDFINNYKQL